MATKNHRSLMCLLEEFIHFLNQEKIRYWIDWGTMLGFKRHQNVIPWDYDCDLCMMSEDYDKLISVFSSKCVNPQNEKDRKYTINRLLCLPDAYADDGCLWIKNADEPESYLGIDVIKYKLIEDSFKYRTILKHCMHQKTCEAYPLIQGSYDFYYEDIFPLREDIMVGIPVLVPNKYEELIVRGYGPDYDIYPPNEYTEWLINITNFSLDSTTKFLNAPFKKIIEFKTITEALKFYNRLAEGEKMPLIVRSPPEFSHIKTNDVIDRFCTEENVLSWHESEIELFNESYHVGKNLYQNWLNDELHFNIVDSPNQHLDLLPIQLKDNIINMSDAAKNYAICYAMTKKNNLTKYHEDVLGDGWVYLQCGSKVWHIIDKIDVEYLSQNGYSLYSIKDMIFSELVTILDGYLWSKIYVSVMGPNDFIYFPQSWAHRVITYDKSFGICGYTKGSTSF